ncbi:MAG: hypothetical protein WAM60_09245 [Candidatus Promineifilaceae bacterium]
MNAPPTTTAVTIWHATRIFDVFLTQHIEGKSAENEIWQTSGWAKATAYDPTGVGTNGWGAVTGYTLEEVAAIPKMRAETVYGYYEEVTGKIRDYLDNVTESELDQPSIGFEGRQPNYFWVRHPLFDLTRHVGESMAIKVGAGGSLRQ